jgi:hypothetical protein
MFATEENRNLELLTQGPVLRHPASIYEKASYYPVDSSTSGGACSGLNIYARPYYLSAMTSQGHPIEKTIIQYSAGAPSSSSLGATPDHNSLKDYPKIGASACWNSAIEACHISMVEPDRGNSQNSSNKYLTIGGSEASDAWTPNNNDVQNLNPDFNGVRLQTII